MRAAARRETRPSPRYIFLPTAIDLGKRSCRCGFLPEHEALQDDIVDKRSAEDGDESREIRRTRDAVRKREKRESDQIIERVSADIRELRGSRGTKHMPLKHHVIEAHADHVRPDL